MPCNELAIAVLPIFLMIERSCKTILAASEVTAFAVFPGPRRERKRMVTGSRINDALFALQRSGWTNMTVLFSNNA